MRCSRSILLLLLTPALALAACGGDDETAGNDPAPASEPAAAPSTTAADTDFSDVKDGECKEVAWPNPKDPKVAKPTDELGAGDENVVTMQTSCGEIVIELDRKHPKTAGAFASLVEEGYFDGLGFHRVVPGLIIQGGDPSGDGTGGPNWQIVEPPADSETYKRGTVAMAKTAADPAGASGSQFFIVIAEEGGYPPEYAVAGKVTKGMEVVEAVAGLGAEGSDGPPSRAAVIGTATLGD